MSLKSVVSKKGFIVFISVVALAGIGTSGYLYYEYQKVVNNPSVSAQTEATDLIKKVSKLMLLPKDESPTIATVSDSSKLTTQTFFKSAKNGDKVLIYAKAKMATLYDPKANIIVAVAPLNVDASSGTQQSEEETKPAASTPSATPQTSTKK